MKNYEDYNKTKISGQNRLLHVNMKGEVLDKYFSRFKYNQTPSRKRKKTTTACWEFLTQECNSFHSRDLQSQKDTLILYLIKCADRSEPSEKPEIDPRKDL